MKLHTLPWIMSQTTPHRNSYQNTVIFLILYSSVSLLKYILFQQLHNLFTGYNINFKIFNIKAMQTVKHVPYKEKEL